MAERVFDFGPLVLGLGVMMLVSMAVTLYAMQLIKRMLGIPLYSDPQYEWVEDWTSADQLFHYAGEQVDTDQGQWKRTGWDGTNAGRGQSQGQRWKDGG